MVLVDVVQQVDGDDLCVIEQMVQVVVGIELYGGFGIGGQQVFGKFVEYYVQVLVLGVVNLVVGGDWCGEVIVGVQLVFFDFGVDGCYLCVEYFVGMCVEYYCCMVVRVYVVQ